ncbi:type IV pilus assembly protein PilA [Neobacillus niacini]|uniref:prepilin-type N-terminal cleavage/methylation domain-containing protein n=1 Tax=Neobacillus niacini TaxID=86668 RepID=UPI0028590DA9|nr:prepilin-type N-terminal cleavage/methylation domain-containing protein [Neobacillus niacini]MDR7077917.1 type IV pilus assembly protein PilA [Neobacillus niacini]
MVNKLGLKLKEQKGFTLIELLAVIVILGIIAAIAIPAIGNVISKSDAKAEAQSGLQIINAAKLYVANENVAAPKNLTDTDLKEYLDSVSDAKGKPATGFSVTVDKATGSTVGKYTYTLKNFGKVADAAGVNEATLIEKAK